MLNLGYFEIAYNENNHLKITEAGKKVLFGKERAQLVVIKREESYGKKGSAKENKTASPTPLFTPTVFENEDEGLFEALRQLRKKLADQLAIPAYIVLSDKTLHLLALKNPVIWRHLVKSVESANSRKKNTGRIFWLSSTNI